MNKRPHVLVTNFEFMILFPICIISLVLCLNFLLERSWGMAFVLLCAALGFGMIGQGLQHRKSQSGQELMGGTDLGDRYGDISTHESNSLGMAMIWTTLLFGIVAGMLVQHTRHTALWAIATTVGSFVLFPVCAFLFIAFWSFLLSRFYTRF